MVDRLHFKEQARLSPAAAEAISDCLQRILGDCSDTLTLLAPDGDGGVVVRRERCLDVCAALLEHASLLRALGRGVAAFALEGVEAWLLDALVGESEG